MSNLGTAIVLLGVRIGVLGFYVVATSTPGFVVCRVARMKVFVRPVINPDESTGLNAFRLMALTVIPGGAMVAAGAMLALLGAGVYYSAALFT